MKLLTSSFVVHFRPYLQTKEFQGLIRMVANYHVATGDHKSQTKLEEFSCCPPPLCMLIISIVELSVFIYYATADCFEITPPGQPGSCATLECPRSFSTPLAYRMCCRSQAWRFFTYALVHASWTHISFNLIIQLLVGIPMEMVHGSWRLLGLYVMGIFGGSLGSSIFDPEANVVGASGAVYALLGSHFANMLQNWDSMKWKWTRLIVLGGLMIADTVNAIVQRSDTDAETTTSYAGHFCGFIMGITFGTYILKNLAVRWWEVYVRWVGVALVSSRPYLFRYLREATFRRGLFEDSSY